ncbi:hypothetical protein KXW65_005949 [Aspergillus fumigatus]|nr:hypothetical protein KXX38_009414 [Aspergillus fumigatus]KAH1390044.1 hypothetical protein KXX49_003120 [Aspergillus fumigatus]KAH1742242.1 hypothetical protein KXX09_001263 [Aspergillus fumigatus]KAH1814131.1 hypothetical protein KXX19_004666 [Aspergillus fumigatus]KAH1863161.1 hypothetical protein KXX01_002988 [Aspergillus fumigatus]
MGKLLVEGSLVGDVYVNYAIKAAGKTGKAMLIADQVVVNEGFEGPSTGPIEEWVKKNAKALMTSDYGPISKSTDCGPEYQCGFGSGATGVGKIGGSGSSLAKATIEGLSMYKVTEKQKALVVSYAGPIYRLHSSQMLHRNPLKQIQRQASEAIEYCKPVSDEIGNQTGKEKIDKEAEKKHREEEKNRIEEEKKPLEEDIVVASGGAVGLTDSDNEAEEEEARVEEEKHKEFMK